ncbi:MAG: BlaI/MecI/CopY family transcriptional regulator [Bacteroidota bacterium]
MKEKQNIKPTSAELEILQILWENGNSTVKFINDELNRNKNVGYTTTLKIMQIMFEKGLLDRERSGRSHIYKPVPQKDETQNVLLEKILETAFAGSASKLVMQALGRSKTSKKEIEEIKEYLAKLEGENNESK